MRRHVAEAVWNRHANPMSYERLVASLKPGMLLRVDDSTPTWYPVRRRLSDDVGAFPNQGILYGNNTMVMFISTHPEYKLWVICLVLGRSCPSLICAEDIVKIVKRVT